ncbi:MAG: NAD(P)H-hydrate dehydratase [Mailhella sp.]|nr:NAD(P)H-hydrate dehydratase [Mailhella sp.]
MLIEVPAPGEIAEWDREAALLGMPEQVLMENAARSATAVLRSAAGSLKGRSVLLLAGAGNNGGDVFCMARHLLEEGASPLLVHTRGRDRYAGAAGLWLSVAETLGVPMCSSDEWEAGLAGASAEGFPEVPDIIVDGILGTGFRGAVREKELGIIRRVNAMAAGMVFAVDVPSGLDAMSGRPCPEAVRADVTVTFQAPKPGLLLPWAAYYTGRTVVAPIGIPRAARKKASFRTLVLPSQMTPEGGFVVARTASEAGGSMDAVRQGCSSTSGRSLPSHKGAAGRVLVVGGCEEYAGAPCLAAHAALRAGAGLVALAAPDTVQASARIFQPALTMRRLHPGGAAVRSWDDVLSGCAADILRGAGCVVLGPGMGRGKGVIPLVEALLSVKGRPPFVIDADALNALADAPSMLALLREDDILTPHPGEAGRLLGISAAEVQGGRFEAAAALAGLARAVWVLKGEGPLIALPGGPAVISPWSVPQLAVAGSGDVLAGIAGAFLSSGGSAGDAAVRAVWTHALAGMVLENRFPRRGCTPLDIADAVPEAVASAEEPGDAGQVVSGGHAHCLQPADREHS